MLDIAKHKSQMVNILKDIYNDVELRTILGFKGGTAALLFYGLTRFSVDLDFDLLQEDKKELVLAKMKKILGQYCEVQQALEKRYTVFLLGSYEKGQRGLKIEISKRGGKSSFAAKSYLGMMMLVVKQEDMVAGKLAALITRKKFAMRDIYDVWFFLKNNWEIKEAIIQEKTGLSLKQALKTAVKKIINIKPNEILQGWGELIEERDKQWVKEKLIQETVFLLKLRLKLGL